MIPSGLQSYKDHLIMYWPLSDVCTNGNVTLFTTQRVAYVVVAQEEKWLAISLTWQQA